ncbi:hypothetical protein [Actinomadura alba]|uniref:Uncharacterized protein n=1 Tax=Actinomadura alba TaxID=406431 RepID=A0ABR7LP81_9ACTN|nr:hypothetical protein [Actinomadura alba]MBC6466556.1 hypothetical protein [Actinomadura alba]
MDEHLLAGVDERDASLLTAADVVVRRAGRSKSEPSSSADVHAHFPGCLVAALVRRGQGCVVTTATGWQARLTPLPLAGPADADDQNVVDAGLDVDADEDDADEDVWSYASLVHAWMVAGRPLDVLNSAFLIMANGRRAVRVGASRTSWGVGAAIA